MVLAITCLTTSIVLGLVTNMVLSDFEPISLSGDAHGFGWINWTTLMMLLALFAYSIYRRGMRSFFLELIPHNHIHDDHGECSHGHSHEHGHSQTKSSHHHH